MVLHFISFLQPFLLYSQVLHPPIETATLSNGMDSLYFKRHRNVPNWRMLSSVKKKEFVKKQHTCLGIHLAGNEIQAKLCYVSS
jgi:hypothetical protein